MNETNKIAEALAQLSGVAGVTRGWPRQTAALPCIAVGLTEQNTADTRDDAAYLTQHVYGIRIFAATMGGCDTLGEAVIPAMQTLGYTLSRMQEVDGETAQQKLTFEKLD